jgi:hypothetical protein
VFIAEPPRSKRKSQLLTDKEIETAVIIEKKSKGNGTT